MLTDDASKDNTQMTDCHKVHAHLAEHAISDCLERRVPLARSAVEVVSRSDPIARAHGREARCCIRAHAFESVDPDVAPFGLTAVYKVRLDIELKLAHSSAEPIETGGR